MNTIFQQTWPNRFTDFIMDASLVCGRAKLLSPYLETAASRNCQVASKYFSNNA